MLRGVGKVDFSSFYKRTLVQTPHRALIFWKDLLSHGGDSGTAQ